MAYVNEHLEGLCRLEDRYRVFLTASLHAVIMDTPATTEYLPTRALLQKLLFAATKSDRANIHFEFEQALPLCHAQKPYGFFEALPRLTDDRGHKLMPGNIFPVINSIQTEVGSTMGALLRLWIAIAQIRTFYETHDTSERLSINIYPADIDHAYQREGLTSILAQAHACGYSNIVLEALESGAWTSERLTFLKGLQEFGITLAIDDYGAADGAHSTQTLADFSAQPLLHPLIVKLDGHTVRDYLDKDDRAIFTRLDEIKAYAPQAKVVAEWVKSAEEAGILLRKIAENGHPEAIHMVQSRDLGETCDIFLKKMASDCQLPLPPQP